jgi:hypothetical protein
MNPKVFILVFIHFASFFCSKAQTITPNVFPAAGGQFVNGCSLTWTIGEPLNTSLASTSTLLTQGEQQPYILVQLLNVGAFIQGFYRGSGSMISALPADPLNTDSITLELHQPVSPFSCYKKAVSLLSITGSAAFEFDDVIGGKEYYLVLRHRNTLETWSSAPVRVLNNMTYSFSLSASNSYGSNVCNMGDGNFALWSGDVDQNGTIDHTDISSIESSSILFTTGYDQDDITGDNMVELTDYSLIESNFSVGLLVLKP